MSWVYDARKRSFAWNGKYRIGPPIALHPKAERNVFIAPLLINDYECSLRFNGYLTVRREF